MKLSHFGISSGVHLAILGLIVFGAFELVQQTTEPRLIVTAPVMDVVGAGPAGQGAPARETGPVIKTPRIKIPVYTYEAPVEEPFEATPAQSTPQKPVSTSSSKPLKTKPAEQPFQVRKPTTLQPAGPAHKWVSVDTREMLQGAGQKDGAGSRATTAAGDGAGASFEELMLGEIRRLLLKYKAGRGDLRAYVSFTVAADGRLLNGALRTSSGDTGFDSACIDAVKRAVLASVPKEFVGQLYSVVIRSED